MPALILIYALVSAAGLTLLKLGLSREGPEQGWLQVARLPSFWVGGLLYGAGFLIWLSLMRRFPLAVVFPIAAGSVFVMTCLLDAFVFDAPPSARTLIGGLVIIAGIGITAWDR